MTKSVEIFQNKLFESPSKQSKIIEPIEEEIPQEQFLVPQALPITSQYNQNENGMLDSVLANQQQPQFQQQQLNDYFEKQEVNFHQFLQSQDDSSIYEATEKQVVLKQVSFDDMPVSYTSTESFFINISKIYQVQNQTGIMVKETNKDFAKKEFKKNNQGDINQETQEIFVENLQTSPQEQDLIKEKQEHNLEDNQSSQPKDLTQDAATISQQQSDSFQFKESQLMHISELKANEQNFFNQNSDFFQAGDEFDLESFKKQLEINQSNKVNQTFEEFAKQQDLYRSQENVNVNEVMFQGNFEGLKLGVYDNEFTEQFNREQQEEEKQEKESSELNQQKQIEILEKQQNEIKNINDLPVAQSIFINQQQQPQLSLQKDNKKLSDSSSSSSSSSSDSEKNTHKEDNNSESSNEIIYQLDEEGHLIDENGEYIMDDNGNMITLGIEHIQYLEQSNLLIDEFVQKNQNQENQKEEVKEKPEEEFQKDEDKEGENKIQIMEQQQCVESLEQNIEEKQIINEQQEI